MIVIEDVLKYSNDNFLILVKISIFFSLCVIDYLNDFNVIFYDNCDFNKCFRRFFNKILFDYNNLK